MGFELVWAAGVMGLPASVHARPCGAASTNSQSHNQISLLKSQQTETEKNKAKTLQILYWGLLAPQSSPRGARRMGSRPGPPCALHHLPLIPTSSQSAPPTPCICLPFRNFALAGAVADKGAELGMEQSWDRRQPSCGCLSFLIYKMVMIIIAHLPHGVDVKNKWSNAYEALKQCLALKGGHKM